MFLNNWVMPYGTPSHVLSYNGPQILSNFTTGVCRFFGVKKLTITAYHRQTIEQAESYNRTIIGRLQHNVSENLRYWDT